MNINTEVSRGYRVEPAGEGFVVFPSGRDGTYSTPIAAFTSPEDLIPWLAGSHQADVVVVSQARFAEAIGASFVQGQASASTKQ